LAVGLQKVVDVFAKRPPEQIANTTLPNVSPNDVALMITRAMEGGDATLHTGLLQK